MILVEYYWTVSRTMLDAFKEVYVMVFLVHWDGLEKGNGYKIVCMLKETETPVKQQHCDHVERRNSPLWSVFYGNTTN